jgi:hypothetical protein
MTSLINEQLYFGKTGSDKFPEIRYMGIALYTYQEYLPCAHTFAKLTMPSPKGIPQPPFTLIRPSFLLQTSSNDSK